MIGSFLRLLTGLHRVSNRPRFLGPSLSPLLKIGAILFMIAGYFNPSIFQGMFTGANGDFLIKIIVFLAVLALLRIFFSIISTLIFGGFFLVIIFALLGQSSSLNSIFSGQSAPAIPSITGSPAEGSGGLNLSQYIPALPDFSRFNLNSLNPFNWFGNDKQVSKIDTDKEIAAIMLKLRSNEVERFGFENEKEVNRLKAAIATKSAGILDESSLDKKNSVTKNNNPNDITRSTNSVLSSYGDDIFFRKPSESGYGKGSNQRPINGRGDSSNRNGQSDLSPGNMIDQVRSYGARVVNKVKEFFR